MKGNERQPRSAPTADSRRDNAGHPGTGTTGAVADSPLVVAQRKRLAGLFGDRFHEPTVQRALTVEGAAYKASILTDRVWGGFVEAQAIAGALQILSGIYIEDPATEGQIRKVADIGAGARAPLSLFLAGNHYRVIAVRSDQGTAVWDEALLVHNPKGDGNCMYEALAYIKYVRDNPEANRAGLSIRFQTQDFARTAKIREMRETAYANIDDASANLAGADVELSGREEAIDVSSESLVLALKPFYEKFPPDTYEIRLDKKNLQIVNRKTKASEGLAQCLMRELKLSKAKEAKPFADRLLLNRVYLDASSKDSELIATIRKARKDNGKNLLARYWEHISLGGLKSDKVTPTGFHWTGRADEALHEQTGERGAANGFGVYHQGVRSKKGHVEKPEGSTFFSDDWTREDFEDAFSKLNSSWEITEDLESGQKAKGMRLVKKGDKGTVFPEE